LFANAASAHKQYPDWAASLCAGLLAMQKYGGAIGGVNNTLRQPLASRRADCLRGEIKTQGLSAEKRALRPIRLMAWLAR